MNEDWYEYDEEGPVGKWALLGCALYLAFSVTVLALAAYGAYVLIR